MRAGCEGTRWKRDASALQTEGVMAQVRHLARERSARTRQFGGPIASGEAAIPADLWPASVSWRGRFRRQQGDALDAVGACRALRRVGQESVLGVVPDLGDVQPGVLDGAQVGVDLGGATDARGRPVIGGATGSGTLVVMR